MLIGLIFFEWSHCKIFDLCGKQVKIVVECVKTALVLEGLQNQSDNLDRSFIMPRDCCMLALA